MNIFSQANSFENISHLSISLEISLKITDFDDDSKRDEDEDEDDEENTLDVELSCRIEHDDSEDLKKVRVIKRKKSKEFDELDI